MSTPEPSPSLLSEDVHRLAVNGRDVILVGTAHISNKSVDLVRQIIEEEKPDCVCVELDPRRYESLSQKSRWENLNLLDIIKKKQLSTLITNLVLHAYQKKLGKNLGVLPGMEILEATKVAGELNIPIELTDRDVRITLRRAWHCTPWWRKSFLLATLFVSLFDKTELTEDKLEEMKRSDVLSELMGELARELPETKRVLIDERDTYLSERIKEAKGAKVLAVVGAGHVVGIKKALGEDRSGEMETITTVPTPSPLWKVAGWSIPAAVVCSIAWIAWKYGPEAAGSNALFWILATGTPAAIGALVALAHPLTILSAFASAPITTLHPLLGVGHVTAVLQTMLAPPMVRELESVTDDMVTFTGWWRNRLLRIFLAFFLPGVGGAIGMWMGSAKIISKLL